MESCKKQYDNIPIPPQLDRAVTRGLRQGRFCRMGKLASTGLAAMLAMVLLVANIPPLAAGAAEVPILGQLVRIMRVGSGGSEASHAHVEFRAEGDSLYLEFDGPVPSYSSVRYDSPERLVLRIHGLAEPNYGAAVEALSVHPALARVYPLATTLPDSLALVLEPVPGQAAVLSQYETYLQLDFSADEPVQKTTVYRLVSPPMDYGPELAQLTDALLWEGATQILKEDGRYQVILGSYPSLERAETARNGIQKHTGILLMPELIQ